MQSNRGEKVSRFSLFSRTSINALCRILRRNGKATNQIEFEYAAIGFKFMLLRRILRTAKTQNLIRKSMVVSLPDGQKILARSIDVPIVMEIYLEKIYDEFYTPKSGDIVFDVGSQIGSFAVKASGLVGQKGEVYAFEPEPDNFQLLKQNVNLNRTTNTKIFDKAVSNHNGELCLYLDQNNTGGHSAELVTNGPKLTLPSVTLDYIIQKYNIEGIDLLKLDVEGHELEVLKGASHFMDICKNIVMETHEKEGGPSNNCIIEELREHDFKTKLVTYSEDNDLLFCWK